VRVLIAEDDRTSRTLLHGLLVREGYDVLVTNDGAEAWAPLQAEDAPRLLVLDWMMPHLDGLELCRRLRQRARPVPEYILMLTTRSGKEDLVAGLGAGANDYLHKPVDVDELRARLRVGLRTLELSIALDLRIHELEAALDHIRRLQGILPICMHCHKIRDDQESWQRIEQYLCTHADVSFSHGVCPDCVRKHYPQYSLDEEGPG
jgi:phosphoserine phosphatase RsbU/P